MPTFPLPPAPIRSALLRIHRDDRFKLIQEASISSQWEAWFSRLFEYVNRLGNMDPPEITTKDLLSGLAIAPASAAWPAANLAIFLPIHLNENEIAKRLKAAIGATPSGNIDVGIYNASWKRQVSSGSTVMGAASQAQIFNITDKALNRGQYYLAIAVDNITATIMRGAPSTITNTMLGIREQAAAFPLPATAAPVESATNNYVPIIGVSLVG